MNNISIIELPFNLGLSELIPGHEPGVKKLPDWLRQHGFQSAISPVSTFSIEAPPYSMAIDKPSGVRNADAIIAYAAKQVPLLHQVLAGKNFPLVIGGDCSILLGNAVALKTLGNYGLFYLDGHHDFVFPGSSSTAAVAGMVLAIITGHGHSKLTDINSLSPYIKEEHVWCAGNREYDEEYEAAIKKSKIKYYDLLTLRNAGIDACVSSFLNMVHDQNLDGFFIHFDVDALDDDIMPAVDSPTPGGLSYTELGNILLPLLNSDKANGMQITILDPEKDPTAKYTKQFAKEMAGILNKAR